MGNKKESFWMGSKIEKRPKSNRISFHGDNNMEIMRLESNGDIYVKGVFVENDIDVVEGLRSILNIKKQ